MLWVCKPPHNYWDAHDHMPVLKVPRRHYLPGRKVAQMLDLTFQALAELLYRSPYIHGIHVPEDGPFVFWIHPQSVGPRVKEHFQKKLNNILQNR